ncbi:unnamed protein product [Ectocarpus sp. 8 AP-2014]
MGMFDVSCCIHLLGVACRAGAMGSAICGLLISPLRDIPPLSSGACLLIFRFYGYHVCDIFWDHFNLPLFAPRIVYSLWLVDLRSRAEHDGARVSWTGTDVRRDWAETGIFSNVKTTMPIS